MYHNDIIRPFFLRAQGLQLLLFGGKGGVGKTTCATSTALYFAHRFPHASFRLLSTDPAHSLKDSLAGSPAPPNLEILELDAKEHMATFKQKHAEKLLEIAWRGTFLDKEDIGQFLDLSLPGLDELMAFLEIAGLVEEGGYDCIIVDTAPTGHTFRLLAMPELLRKWLAALDALLAKHGYMKRLFCASYDQDEIDEFLTELSDSVERMATLLGDPVRCRFVPVMLAEELSIRETLNLLAELERLKIHAEDIVVNMLYPENNCPACMDGRAHQIRGLRQHWQKLSDYSLWGVPLYAEEIRGLRQLKVFWEGVSALDSPPLEVIPHYRKRLSYHFRVEGSADLPSPEMKLLLFAGKGGVGKTTLACATAVRMARDFAGKEIFLFSTDPAHSLSACLDAQIGPKPTRLAPGLTAMEIDAPAEFESLKGQYMEEIGRLLGAVSSNIDLAFDREAMERIMDLSPPGLDEIMALSGIMRFLDQGRYDIFILDSAPTGHMLRLLELPEIIDQWLKVFFNLLLKYKNVFRLPNISQRLVQMSKEIKRLRCLLTDTANSAVFAVTILTTMAFQETRDLVAACQRMSLSVPMMFINLATLPAKCHLCSALNKRELQLNRLFKETFSGIPQVMIYRQVEPRGINRLEALGKALYKSAWRVSYRKDGAASVGAKV